MKSVGPLMPPLDDAPGPAIPLSRPALREARVQILTGVAQRTSRRAGLRAVLRPVPIAASLAALLLVGSGAAAAVRLWPALREAVVGPAAPAPKVSARSGLAPAKARARPAPRELVPPAQKVPAEVPTRHVEREAVMRAPTDLLARANELRAQKRWGAAEAIYLRVLERGAGSRESSTAALAAAELRLSKLARPRAALQLFERALREEPHGALAEQARHGIARSQRALGDSAAEARALRAFIEAHPRSLMRPTAERRLRALDTVR